ncbi:DMT family transporter [Candidatus Marinimicrobia bacterium]|nr:DMT family transporter [Candidatus Neomarinimicrobiota bacterium]
MNSKITLLLILALLSVSTSPIIGRALVGVNAVSISFWRMFIAAIVLWLFSLIKPQGKMKVSININRTICAGILLGIHFALFFEAIKITKIANATFLGTLAPFFTLIIELYILKRYYSSKILLGLFLTLIGSIIILGYQFNIESQYTIGNLYAVLCSICIAIALMIGEKVRQKEDTIVYTRLLYLSASFTLFIISILVNETLLSFNRNEFLGLVFLGLVPTILGHNSIYYSLKYVPPTIVAAFPLGEPIIATFFAFFIFSEYISLNIFIGGCITGIGLVLISIYKKE